ncbi:sigma 54-interacting transcriptional regulator [Wukongibacter baidiensis]|uniref:sigma-54 interaction domain-containing protein n=1 Tax=Wukongibacter baidiensis TaxID=1723361 RepID=UPI003D7FC436
MKKALKNTDIICIVDKEGYILYYNNYDDITNRIGKEEVIGMHLLEVYPWLTRETSTLLKVIDTGEPIINHSQVIKVSDDFVVNSINSAFPLKNKSGIIGGVVVSINLDKYNTKSKKMKVDDLRLSLNAKYSFDDIITQNQEIIDIKNKLKKAAKKDSNIFLYGETGTGKELFAHSIHNWSNRYDKPFIAQNCAAIPESIAESILFGTTKGSFTGAVNKKGIFEMADGGTIFLDEINSMSIDLQVKLLRAIEEKSIRKIGDDKSISVDVRIIASTNEGIDDLIKQGKFRSDLFYRINVVNAKILPLRDRKEDVDYLCKYFINQYNRAFKENVKGIEAKAKTLLNKYNWPGNVRQLKNCIESAFNSLSGEYIRASDLPDYIIDKALKNENSRMENEKSLIELTDSFEKKIILEVLDKVNNNIAMAARILKVPRQTIYYKLKKHKIDIKRDE